MITKIMGLGDILAAITAVLVALFPDLLPRQLVFIFAGYLVLKGGMFAMSGNLVSFIDVFSPRPVSSINFD